MANLEPGHDYPIEIRYQVVPKADNEMILDTTFLTNTYILRTPTADDYQRNLVSRGISRNSFSWVNGNLTIIWSAVNDDFLRYTIVTYKENGVEKVIEVPNDDTETVLPRFTLGSTIQVRSNFEVVGVPDTYIDSFDKEFDPPIDLNRTDWKCIYTSVQPATDGFPSGTDPSVGAHNAHIDNDIRTMLSLAKPTRNVNGSNNTANIPCVFVLDLNERTSFNFLRVHSRTTDTGDGLRVWALRIFGSDNYLGPMNKFTNPAADGSNPDVDPTNWVPIGGEVVFPEPRQVEGPNMTLPLGTFRYIKVEYTRWQPPGNSAMQMAEFHLGITSSRY